MGSGTARGEGTPDRAQLVERAVAGDTVALTALLAETRSATVERLHRWVPFDLQSTVSADDAVQDAHVEVFHRIATFRAQHGHSFDRWVSAIALRRLRSILRAHRSLKRGGGLRRTPTDQRIEESTVHVFDMLVGPGRTPSRSAVRRELVAAVHAAIDELSDDYRLAVWQVHIDGRSPREVAATMGRTERAIHGLCRRGLSKVRTKLETLPQFSSWH